jgi:two-component system, NarL family, sensor histidine kinase UhpB
VRIERVGSSDSDKPEPPHRDSAVEKRLRRAAMDEAQHLAAEIHDGIGQELAGISLMLAALQRVPQARDREIQEPLEHISGLVVQAMVSCRRVSEGFGGFLVREQGLTAALLHFASQFDDEGTRVEFRGRDIPSHWLDEITAYHLFGIGREAIFNAFRHSQGRTIRVTCDHAEARIHLVIEDDGVGLRDTTSRERGMGRSIMEFRASSIGACLRFTAVSSGGLRVECSLDRSSLPTLL